MGLLDKLFGPIDDDLFYSDKWMRNASDAELSAEREKVCQKHRAGDERAQSVLWRFDDEMRKRECAGCEDGEYKYPAHTEHGWYLSEDD